MYAIIFLSDVHAFEQNDTQNFGSRLRVFFGVARMRLSALVNDRNYIQEYMCNSDDYIGRCARSFRWTNHKYNKWLQTLQEAQILQMKEKHKHLV